MIVDSGGARLAVDVSGPDGGAPVLMLHSGVNDRRSFGPLVEAFAADGAGVRGIAFDRRGFGETTCTPEPHSHVDDAVAVLDAVLAGDDDPGDDPGRAVAVVGASMGGRVALDLALAHPDRVSALVLIGSAVRGAPELVPDPPEVNRLEARLDAAEEAGDLDEVNRIEAHVWLDGPLVPEGRVPGPARELFLDMNGIALAAPDPGPEDELPSAWDRLDDIDVPALVIIGELDLPDIVARAEALAERLPRAELVRLAGTAHLPHLEPHPGCLPAIVHFLATHR